MSQAQAPAPTSEIFQWCPRPRKDKAVRPVDDLAWTEPEKLAMQVISITYHHGEPVGIEYNARVRTEYLENDDINNVQAMDYAITMDSVQRMFPVGLRKPFGLPSPAFNSSYRLVRDSRAVRLPDVKACSDCRAYRQSRARGVVHTGCWKIPGAQKKCSACLTYGKSKCSSEVAVHSTSYSISSATDKREADFELERLKTAVHKADKHLTRCNFESVTKQMQLYCDAYKKLGKLS